MTAVLRGVHLAAMLSLLGTAAFMLFVLPAASGRHEALQRHLVRLWRLSGVAALLAGVGWLAMQAAAIAGTQGVAELAQALPVVVAQTRFGQMLLLRFGLLAGATLLAGVGRPRLLPGLALAAAAAALEGWIGHAGAAGGAAGNGLVGSEALHLLAAGVWLGALVPLWLAVRMLPAAPAAAVCERFSPVGLACVLVLAGTGLVQGLQLIGSVPALLGTAYGRIALLKLGLFLLAVVLAAGNRLWLTDRLADDAEAGRRLMLVSVGLETLLGLAIIVAAAFLASAVPAVHEQPVWPLSWRFSLVTVDEDPDFRREVIVSLLLMTGAILLMAGALVRRRFRLAAVAVLIGVFVWRAPSLSLLTVDAYPTSFETSPTGFAAAAIVRGAALFQANCAACHGPDGTGDGPAAAGRRIQPADLTQPHIWEHTDGEMAWWLSHGIEDPEGGLAMPGFAASLSGDDRWALIDFVRAHQAGTAMRRSGRFDVPVRAPAISLACDGRTATRLGDLAGHVVLVATAENEGAAMPPHFGVPTVMLMLAEHGVPRVAPGQCAAADPAAWGAYAVLAGVQPAALGGMQFLIDAHGWLRAVGGPGRAGDWHSPAALIAAVRAIYADPVVAASETSHEHHH